MGNKDQLIILLQGVAAWNKWRTKKLDDKIDLSGANLIKAYLSDANLSGADLSGAKLIEADLSIADLSKATLTKADLRGTNFSRANFSMADLSGADLSWADLSEANLEGATLTNCYIYAISAWSLKLNDETKQRDLIITPPKETDITIDNIEVAQFVYLLLHNEKIRDVIDTITSKVVLILGRFTPERKAVLDAIRDELRKHNYLPVMFDFDKTASRDLTETISTLAHMARFVIADITDASAVPTELERITPGLPSVPIVILIHRSNKTYALFDHIRRYPWVLEPYRYEDQAELIASIGEKIIASAEKKVRECGPPSSAKSRPRMDR
jgi:uncharacterized protein YjbI with pentapeptide repeats